MDRWLPGGRWIAVFGLACAACSTPVASEPDEGAVFVVEVSGERFRVRVDDPARTSQAREILASGRAIVVSGDPARGDGGFNRPYDWHLTPRSVAFVEAGMELCDALPSHVQADVGYWVDTIQQYCPWSARIVAEE